MKINPNANAAPTQQQERVDLRQQQNAPVELERRNAAQGTHDRTELSNHSERARTLRAQLESVPEIRSDRVAELREAIRSGRYQVNSQSLADAILRDFGPENLR